ncbi:LacI family DNA-binding transcriptional regulator [Amaricoccus tamworthensis]|uniref:LacI family DNA-binding transcriptional regulator n=1 Tax=Amaricoccus tamworthensis TaxID=57002 RepID=UPI003C7CF8EA
MQKRAGKKRANLRDVASKAGVSVATVSRVMNNPDSVAPDTRERVETAMRALHWTPSAAARAINSGRTRFVGALVPTLDSDIFARVLAEMESRLALHRLSLVVATTGGDADIEAQKAQALLDIGAEGLLVSGAAHSPEFRALLERTRLPAVATSWYDPDFLLPTVGYDNRAAANLALGHLADLRHTRIAVLHGPVENNDRTEARLSALRESDVELSFHQTALSVAGGRDATREVIRATPQPSALLCLSDVLAAGAIYECHHAGIKVPQDMSIIGTDDLPGSSQLHPALTTVHLPVGRMGRIAADAIANWVEAHQRPADRLLDIELMVRETTAPPVG